MSYTLCLAVSVVLFILSLLIFFSVRAGDKKTRTLANINQQIKSFRSEVAAQQQRVRTDSQDCVDNVQSHIEKARSVVEVVNTCLDRLAQHAKDLSALEEVCVDYKRALDKLKVQTDQAENRILVVQQEIRKAESVNEFVRNFHEETELLVNQMQDLKAEYIRLVTSTQESLKQQSALQKNENSEMLATFSSLIDRQKSQLVEFVNVEKQGFVRECDEQTRIAETMSARASELKGEVEDAVRSARSALSEMKDGFKTYLDSAESEIISYKSQVKDILDAAKSEINDNAGDIEKLADETAQKLNSSFDALVSNFNEKKSQIERDAEERISEAEERITNRENEMKDNIANLKREIDDRLISLSREKESFTEKTRVSFRAVMLEERDEIRKDYEKIMKDCQAQIDILAQRASETRETVATLSLSETEKINQTVSRLNELGAKITQTEATLTSLSEQVTSQKEELYKKQQDHSKIIALIGDAQKELTKAEQEIKSAKENRIKEEAELVKIRLEKDKEKDKKKKETKSRAETIIEAFPDDIFIGEEEEIPMDDDE